MEIGFIDYSFEERNKILSTLKMLGDQNVLDELGIGVIRDAYSDILFPGISTLQTRAKYFVLIPHLFHTAKRLAEKGKIHSGKELQQWINDSEDKLAASLTNNCPPGETGIIGSTAYRNKRSVKVKPSAIYWAGLRTLGIFKGGSMNLSAACKMTYAAARRKAETEIIIDGESFDDPTALDQGSALFLFVPNADYEKNVTMDLTVEEAKFLSECIQRSSNTSGSLLAFLVKHGNISKDFKSIPVDLLPDALRRDYLLARDFSRFIYGAHIRYNVIYSEYTDQDMINRFNTWQDDFLSEPFELEPILKRVTCSSDLAAFCCSFLDDVRKNDTAAMDNLIISREKQVKRDRSKLRKPKEYRYDPNHPIHMYELDYRYGRARVIIQDILNGLGGETHV